MTFSCGLKNDRITLFLGTTFAFLFFRLLLLDERKLSVNYSLIDILGGDKKANNSDHSYFSASRAQSRLWGQRVILYSQNSSLNTSSPTLNLSILSNNSTKL